MMIEINWRPPNWLKKITWHHSWPFLLLFALAIVFYWPTTKAGYSGFDDTGLIRDNISILNDWRNWPLVFQRDAWLAESGSFFRPLQTFSYMLDLKIAGGEFLGWFHFHNVLLFALIVPCLYYLLLQLKTPRRLALLIATWVVANPLFVHLTAWIPARGDLQLTLFALLTLIFFIHYLQTKTKTASIIYLILVIVNFALALLAKESALGMPVILVAYFLIFQTDWRLKKNQPHNLKTLSQKIWPQIWQRHHLVMASGLILVALIWQYLRSQMLFLDKSISVNLANFIYNLRALPESLTKFFCPINIQIISFYSALLTGSGLVIIALLFYLGWRDKKHSWPVKLFGWGWFLLLMIPSMSFRFVDMAEFLDFLDHRLLLPLTGIMIYLTFIFRNNFNHWRKINSKIYLAIIIAIILLGGIAIRRQIQFYSDEITFWNTVVTQNGSGKFYVNRAGAKNDYGDRAGAYADYETAIAISPHLAEAYNGRAILRVENGDYAGAIADYDQAISLAPTRLAWIYFNRGEAHKTFSNYQLALTDYQTAYTMESGIINAYQMAAFCEQKLDHVAGALVIFDQGLIANPKNVDLYNDRGILRAQNGDLAGAKSDWQTAIKLDPENPMPRYNLKMLSSGQLENSPQN